MTNYYTTHWAICCWNC